MNEAKVGDRIRRYDGTVGTVTGLYEDVKNGSPGIDFADDKGGLWWCYEGQYEVIRRAAR